MVAVWNRTVIAYIFAIGTFRFGPAVGIEISFDDVFGVGRNPKVVGHAFDNRHGRASGRTHEGQFVYRRGHGQGGDRIRRMKPDGEGDRQPVSIPVSPAIDGAKIAGSVQIDAGFLAAAQHQSAHPHIGAPAGVDGKIECR